MQGTSELQTWQPGRRLPLVIAALMLALAAATVVFIVVSVWRGAGPFWLMGINVVFASAMSWTGWRYSKRRTTASPQGVETFDGFQTRRVKWSQVQAIHPSRYDPVVELKLSAGEPMHLFGVVAEDVPELAALRDSAAEPPV